VDVGEEGLREGSEDEGEVFSTSGIDVRLEIGT
jgi:hypothetical protein